MRTEWRGRSDGEDHAVAELEAVRLELHAGAHWQLGGAGVHAGKRRQGNGARAQQRVGGKIQRPDPARCVGDAQGGGRAVRREIKRTGARGVRDEFNVAQKFDRSIGQRERAGLECGWGRIGQVEIAGGERGEDQRFVHIARQRIGISNHAAVRAGSRVAVSARTVGHARPAEDCIAVAVRVGHPLEDAVGGQGAGAFVDRQVERLAGEGVGRKIVGHRFGAIELLAGPGAGRVAEVRAQVGQRQRNQRGPVGQVGGGFDRVADAPRSAQIRFKRTVGRGARQKE